MDVLTALTHAVHSHTQHAEHPLQPACAHPSPFSAPIPAAASCSFPTHSYVCMCSPHILHATHPSTAPHPPYSTLLPASSSWAAASAVQYVSSPLCSTRLALLQTHPAPPTPPPCHTQRTPPGIYIVINGLCRAEVVRGGRVVSHYVGVGGQLGMVSSVVGGSLRGMQLVAAFAQVQGLMMGGDKRDRGGQLLGCVSWMCVY